MNKNIFILFSVLVLLSISVIAPGTVITNTGQEGYQIETTPYAYIIQEHNFTANFHIFNISTGKQLTNNSIVCGLHVYDHYGEHIYENNSLTYNTADMEWSVFLNKTYFATKGIYSWIVFCNSSTYGGFRSEVFEITSDGHIAEPNANAGLPIIYFMLFIIIGLFVLGFVGKFNKHEIVNLVLQRGCIVGAIMLMMYTTTLLLNIVTYAHLDILSKEMIFLMTWIGWAGYVAAVYLVIQTLFDILRLKKEKRLKRVYENG